MDGYRTDNAEGQERMKDDFRERIQDLDKYYSDALEEMTTNLEQVRNMAKNQVNNKERELTELMTKHAKDL